MDILRMAISPHKIKLRTLDVDYDVFKHKSTNSTWKSKDLMARDILHETKNTEVKRYNWNADFESKQYVI